MDEEERQRYNREQQHKKKNKDKSKDRKDKKKPLFSKPPQILSSSPSSASFSALKNLDGSNKKKKKTTTASTPGLLSTPQKPLLKRRLQGEEKAKHSHHKKKRKGLHHHHQLDTEDSPQETTAAATTSTKAATPAQIDLLRRIRRKEKRREKEKRKLKEKKHKKKHHANPATTMSGSASPSSSPTTNTTQAVKRPAADMNDHGDIELDSPQQRATGIERDDDVDADGDRMEGVEPSASSVDARVQHVLDLIARPIHDGDKGYLLTATWLNRILLRCSDAAVPAKHTLLAAAKPLPKDDTPVGPVDNSDLVPATYDTSLKDTDGKPFIPIKPELAIGEDFHVLPEDAWQRVCEWYGQKQGSPVIIRHAHNTTPDDEEDIASASENVQYELRPPVITILRLSHTADKDADKSAVSVVASRSMPFMRWLKAVKIRSGVDIATKVRVWRLLEAQRDSKKLFFPVAEFSKLGDGAQKELLEMTDQTANEKYNGKATLEHAGLANEQEVVVLEEQLAGKAWTSEVSPAKALHLTGAVPKGVATGRKEKENATPIPAPAPAAAKNEVPEPLKKKDKKEMTLKEKKLAKQQAKTATTTGIRRRKDGRPIGVTGLVNLGNTCYMNSALQCVRSVEELTRYFLADEYKHDLNPSNPLSHDGNVARAYANLLHQIFDVHAGSAFSPRQFKGTIGRYGPSFSGYGQQDSQEFIMFLLDGLQEDLNRIMKKPYIEKPDSTDDMVHDFAKLTRFADEHWRIYKARNDSVVTDLFAGMYKSTLHCPECDKVSIIFDPFHNLTLQLPVENSWTHEVLFYPVRGAPVSLDVEIDKNSSVKTLKAHVAKKVGLNIDEDPDIVKKLVFAETYGHRFYKMFDNQVTLGDAQIQARDEVAVFELEDVPTSYNPDYHRGNQGYRSMLFSRNASFGDDDDADEDRAAKISSSFASNPKSERILVPIYHRIASGKRGLVAQPGYILIHRDEAFDYDTLLKKIFRMVANLTTRDVISEADAALAKAERESKVLEIKDAEDTDTDMDRDGDADMSENDAKAKGTNGQPVDVAMTDATSTQDGTPRILRPGVPLPRGVHELFQIKYAKSNEDCPTSLGSEHADFRPVSSRLTSGLPYASRSRSRKPNGGVEKNGKREASAEKPAAALTNGDADGSDLAPQVSQVEVGSDSESEKAPSAASRSASRSSASRSRSRSVSRSRQQARDDSPRNQRARSIQPRSTTRSKVPLIYPGEAIVLDWQPGAFSGFFSHGGAPVDGGAKADVRGKPTWENAQTIDDPELAAKRVLRKKIRNHGLTLDQCLDEYGREEILSENDAWYCPRCKTHRRASKKFELWRTPDILVMHLKRFSSNRIFRDKLDALVDFPQTLDMSDRVMCPEEGKSLEYELIAVDNHYGGLGGGHYTAFAKNFVDGNWYEYNDSHVTRVSDEGRVVSRAAYLLFYRRKSSKPLGGPYLEKVVQQSRVSENASSTDSDSDDDDNAGSASSRGTSRSRSRSSSRSRKSGAAFSSSHSESVSSHPVHLRSHLSCPSRSRFVESHARTLKKYGKSGSRPSLDQPSCTYHFLKHHSPYGTLGHDGAPPHSLGLDRGPDPGYQTYLPSARDGDRERNHTNAIFGNNHTAHTSPLATTTANNAYHQRTNPTHSTASAHAHPRRTSRDGYDSLYDDDDGDDDDDDDDDGGVRLYGSNTRVGLSGASKQPGAPAASALASANQPAWSFPPTPSGETANSTSSGTRTLRNAEDWDDDEEMDVASIKSTDAQRGRDSDEEDGTGSGDVSLQRARLSSLIDLPGSDEDEDDDMPVVELKRPEEEEML